MTNNQIKQAIHMREAGFQWSVTASIYKTTTDKLRKERLAYEQQFK